MQHHYQCVPLRHIRDFTWLKIYNKDSPDYKLLKHMEQTSIQFIKEKHPGQVELGNLRIGFHSPGHNSQHHLHMHLVIPPFKGSAAEQKKYD